MAAIVISTVVSFIVASFIGRSYPLLAGLAPLAYILGLRHGLDADHIAAIDNTTRRFTQEGKSTFSVGMWFSLGHSTVVVALVLALVFATRAVVNLMPGLIGFGFVMGTTISATFLWVVAAANAALLLETYRVFRELREGRLDETQLEAILRKRGFMNRYFGRLFGAIRERWQIYPVGLLFGLGFDTASEVALFAISISVGAGFAGPIWLVLMIPLLFACGMVLVDTADGAMMSLAYGWAFLRPIRKIFYNMTITFASVAVAFLIGGLEFLQVLSAEVNLNGGIWESLKALNSQMVGLWIVVLFMAIWFTSMAIYHTKHYEDSLFDKAV